MSDADHDATWQRLAFGHQLDAVGDCDLVIEAVAEDEAMKIDVFGRLDALCKPEAVLASNTSSIPIMKLARATKRESQVIGIHFFNPVPVLPLVELVTSLLTSAETATDMEEFASDTLGKTVIRSRDRAGFIVNSLLIPYILAAIRMLESGFATADDIDTGMVKGCAHPMGPLAAGGSHRSRHGAGGRRVAVQRVQGAAVHAAFAAAADGRGRVARSQSRARFL